MAGITDLPFRNLCREFGAGLTCSEMLTSDVRLWHSPKSSRRLPNKGEVGLKTIQIAGTEASQLARAAALCEQLGADIIDINMGCPAKKVCKKQAGAALMRDEVLVAKILKSVVAAVDIPVTLKIRTGWDIEHRNGPTIAVIAEDSGVQALSVHGRTRNCRFDGEAEYDTIAEIVRQVSIPVIANGDITTGPKAEEVLNYTGAAGLMIGRGAFGKPWLFAEINQHLNPHSQLPFKHPLPLAELINRHLQTIHEYYGEVAGVRIARKHMAWYLQTTQAPLPTEKLNTLRGTLRRQFNALKTVEQQLHFVDLHRGLWAHCVQNTPLPQNKSIDTKVAELDQVA